MCNLGRESRRYGSRVKIGNEENPLHWHWMYHRYKFFCCFLFLSLFFSARGRDKVNFGPNYLDFWDILSCVTKRVLLPPGNWHRSEQCNWLWPPYCGKRANLCARARQGNTMKTAFGSTFILSPYPQHIALA